MDIRNKTLAYEFGAVVQQAIKDGRVHLNDDEANHLLKISERLIKDYIKELENSDEDLKS